MKRFISKLYWPILILFCTSWLAAENSLVLLKNQHSRYTIRISRQADAEEKLAAKTFRNLFKEISGVELKIKKGLRKKYGILVAKSHRLKPTLQLDPLKEDGFAISSTDKTLMILGGSRKGVLYGVYSFFEQFAGCRWLTHEVKVFPKHQTLIIPETNRVEVPVFNYRQVHYRHTFDSVFREAHKLDMHHEEWGMWVHTFFRLLGPDRYFDQHPEYFAEVNGKRTPHTQLCLTNPMVLEIVCESLKTMMAAKPTTKYWSVSQMDTYGYCTCANCKAIDQEEGSPSGTILRFVNQIASRFPDKIISTLAYQYSRKPPAISIPRENVNIMFCSIELPRNQAIDQAEEAASFRRDMEGWRKLTGNIMTWDYVIQFSNLFGPFPNLHVLQPNLQYFAKNNAIAHFQQGNREIGGDMHEVRAYLISKLLWNPNVNIDSVREDFLKHYYGPAASLMDEYIRLLHENLIKSGFKLEIFGNPSHHSSGYLSPDNLEIYEDLFDRAEKKVQNNAEYLHRVQTARLPIMYAKLEIGRRTLIGQNGMFEAHAKKWRIKPEYTNLLSTFTERCLERKIERITEWHTTPKEYAQNYPVTLDIEKIDNDAAFSHVTYVTNANPKYLATGSSALVDGLKGGLGVNSMWQGWEVSDMHVVIDLGKIKDVKEINTGFLHSPSNWIFKPLSIDYLVSSDGKNYKNIYSEVNDIEDLKHMRVKKETYSCQGIETQGRYIRIIARNVAKCPTANCKNGDAWLFCDEVVVKEK